MHTSFWTMMTPCHEDNRIKWSVWSASKTSLRLIMALEKSIFSPCRCGSHCRIIDAAFNACAFHKAQLLLRIIDFDKFNKIRNRCPNFVFSINVLYVWSLRMEAPRKVDVLACWLFFSSSFSRFCLPKWFKVSQKKKKCQKNGICVIGRKRNRYFSVCLLYIQFLLFGLWFFVVVFVLLKWRNAIDRVYYRQRENATQNK